LNEIHRRGDMFVLLGTSVTYICWYLQRRVDKRSNVYDKKEKEGVDKKTNVCIKEEEVE
jgi:hypothetical protein